MAADPELRSHQEWLGYLQPVGLVVSAPALVAAQAFVNRNVAREQQRLAAVVAPVRLTDGDGAVTETVALHDFPAFAREVLDWQPADLRNGPGQPALPDELVVALPEYGDTLKPTYAVPAPEGDAAHFLLLVELVPFGTDLDRDPPPDGRRWQASPQARFERLLRETGVPIGLLCNGTHLRLVYRPPGESSGHLTFPVAAMTEPAGRPILGALLMLLGAERLFTLPPNQRLPHILRESRKYQNDVSTALAEQVLGALHDLLRGFQAADDATRGALLADVLREARGAVYGGLLTVLLRLVFVLYAEDRGLLGGDPVYQASYSLTGLFASLREDAARHPDTMELRYGAWARLLVLFRLVHDGASHGSLHLPPRYGRLFDPDVYPFLEGRPHGSLRQRGERLAVPKVPDGVVHRVLDALLVLDGERLSYRALDVEQIGSVYEAMMGFALETATGPSIAVKPQHVVVDLGALLKKSGAERVKHLADEAGCKLPAAQAERVKAAKTVEELVAALDKRVSPRTPRVVPAGGMFLQPGEERRRSGSHYTPRSLTEPIVRTTLRPVLDALRSSASTPQGAASSPPSSAEKGSGLAELPKGTVERGGDLAEPQPPQKEHLGDTFLPAPRAAGPHPALPRAPSPWQERGLPTPTAEALSRGREAGSQFTLPHDDDGAPSPDRERGRAVARGEVRPSEHGEIPRPEAILALKVCDPAMGSGAFLVEVCRALGDVLLASWQRYGLPDDLPEGEDPLLHARRLVAQRCLYGVDKNPFAVDLARLSLWLVTLAKDHPFTFLDHALRQGDSLVGLSREQIACVHWEVGKQVPLVRAVVEKAVREAEARRAEIHARAMGDDVGEKRRLLDDAERAIGDARMIGDCVVAAFFDEEKDGARKKRVKELAEQVTAWAGGDAKARAALEGMARGLRERTRAVTPFHWEVEFPEVFSRDNGGFDAVVGNPPFLGGTKIGGELGLRYHEYLPVAYPGATGLADIVAFFLRRSFDLLCAMGTFGLICTNTVTQGDTRSTGLGELLRRGGQIYEATRRYRWPGEAAVIVSVVHAARGQRLAHAVLDGKRVARVSAYLLPGRADDTPVEMVANKGLGYVGSKIWGAGFLFEETPSEASSSIEEMRRLVEADPRCSEVIFAYMGGEEFNTSPTLSHSRYVIDFGEMSEREARQWPSLFSIVEEHVRPVRLVNKQRNYRENWWLHVTRVPEAVAYVRANKRLLALSQVSLHFVVGFVGEGTVYANTLVLALLHTYSAFAAMQSRAHEVWSRFVGSTLEDRLRYTASDCFDTFPFPAGVLEAARGDASAQALPALQRLEDVGQRYYEFRAQLMVAHNEGLTATYNCFHDPEERDEGILQLRALHAEMDRAVLDAYGWTDVETRCEFLLDYEEEGDAEEESGKRRKKRPWRYRWPDAVRDEVLARLIALNGERAAEERRAGEALAKAAGAGEKLRRAARKKKGDEEGQGGLFG